MLVTPNRFTRTSQTAYWNTGNGSPDAIELMVDKPGIVIAGICLYGGEGSYNYELELLDEVLNWNYLQKKKKLEEAHRIEYFLLERNSKRVFISVESKVIFYTYIY